MSKARKEIHRDNQEPKHFTIHELTTLLFAAIVAISTAMQGIIFYIDRSAPYQNTVYAQNASAILTVVERAHGACNEMGSTIRLLQRANDSDPATVESTWNVFANSGTIIELVSNDEVALAFLDLQRDLLGIRTEFLKWKHAKLQETYDEADLHAANLQAECVHYIRKFVYSSRATQGYDNLSKLLSERFGQNIEQVYRGGGDGGGG